MAQEAKDRIRARRGGRTWRVGLAGLAVAVAVGGCVEAPLGRDAGPADHRVDRPQLEATPDLFVRDVAPSQTDRCGGGSLVVPPPGGELVLQGTTAQASNEYGRAIRCGRPEPLAGPQRYYRLSATAGRSYRLELRPSFAAVLYLFSACSPDVINADCASRGSSGGSTGTIPAGETQALVFTPLATGVYHLAVDGASGADHGSYSLSVREFAAPAHAACVSPQQLALSAGKASVSGSTLGAPNEFGQAIGCNLGLSFDGPQVYYSVSLSEKTWYRLRLEPDFRASLYVVNAAASCRPANLDQDCGGLTGTVLAEVPPGGSGATAFSPPASGSYLLVVDSVDPAAAGRFTLTVESFVPPENMVCSQAASLTAPAGPLVVSGDTRGLLNDLGALMSCAGGPRLLGGQAYYSVPLVAKRAYQFILRPTFNAALAVGAGCASLPADCGTGGLSGGAVVVGPGQAGSTVFSPPASGTYVFSVEGRAPEDAGTFEVELRELTGPRNGTCVQPATLAARVGKELVEAGDTGPLTNDLSGITCGSGKAAWSGGQAYYRVTVPAGRSVQLALQPESGFDAALYAFPAATSCSTDAVNAACAGMWSDRVGPGVAESLTLGAPTSTDYLVVVDSWSASDLGTYTLRVSLP